MYEESPHGPREAVPRSMDIDRDRMTVEFASKVADLGNWDSMERILFSHKTMTMISNQNLYKTRNPYIGDYLHEMEIIRSKVKAFLNFFTEGMSLLMSSVGANQMIIKMKWWGWMGEEKKDR